MGLKAQACKVRGKERKAPRHSGAVTGGCLNSLIIIGY